MIPDIRDVPPGKTVSTLVERRDERVQADENLSPAYNPCFITLVGTCQTWNDYVQGEVIVLRKDLSALS